MALPLLKTKLNMPHLRPQLVSRAHLLDRLTDNLFHEGEFTRKLTLIAAPAGYGKTTLATEWLYQRQHPAAWLSLDEGDNDPTRFLAYLIAALQHIQGDLGLSARAMLQAPQTPPIEIILTNLLNEVQALPEPFFLTLDDYHLIHTPEIHQHLAFILEHQPTQMHLVLTTREDPLLPIARLRARGQVVELRQQDLRFTSDEISRFLKQVMNLSLTPDEIARLERRTEGWIAGLQLAALSMQGRGDLKGFVQSFTGSNRYVLDYLIEEVFAQQSKEVQVFLEKTSILEQLSGPLCDAVLKDASGKIADDFILDSSSFILERLEQANLFVVPLDQSRTWYRYHRLFAELLRHRLRLMNQALENELHLRASHWYEQNEFIPEAVQHALSAHAWERAAALIESRNTAMLSHGEMATLIRWYQAFPQEFIYAHPRTCFDYCWPLLLTGQYEAAAPLLDYSEQMAQTIPPFLGEVLAAQAYLARSTGNHALMVEKSRQALGLLPKSSVNSRGLVAMNLGLAYWHMGQMQAAEEPLAEAVEAGQATNNPYMRLTAIIFQGRTLAVRGQLHRAADIFQNVAGQAGQLPINILAHLDLAALYYEWNELETSETHMQQAIALSQRTQDLEYQVACWMMQARLCMAQEDLTGAEDALNQGWALVHSGKIPEGTAVRMDAAQALLDIRQNGKSGAETWAGKLNAHTDCHNFYRFIGVAKGQIMIHAGELDAAQAYLAQIYETGVQHEWGYGALAARVWQARAAQAPTQAVAFLIDALEQAEPEGFVRTFVEAGVALVPHLQEAARRGIAPELVGKILSALGTQTPREETAPSPLPEPLSEREVEVLRLVTAGLSNREIAAKLFISTGTAKTHVHNLCGKMGVRNRVEAATKAKDLNIV